MRIYVFVFVLAITGSSYADVLVSTMSELETAINNVNNDPLADRTILIADGTYRMTSGQLPIRREGVTVKSQSGVRENVVIQGQNGMNGGVIEFIFSLCADNITIQDMTLEDVGSHAVMVHGEAPCDADNATIRNLVIRDTFEQMIKGTPSNSDPDAFYTENGLVENCLMYYTADFGPQYYIGGIDVHAGKDWIVRNNTFKNIRSSEMGAYAEHAIHFWSWSQGTISENNLIINCDRGIGYGLGNSGHTGGIIRNNILYHADLGEIGDEDMGDAGIFLENSPDTQVYNNTIWFEHDYPNSIEYRFSVTTNALIANNLTNRSIRQRDGASATVTHNVETAISSWFTSLDPNDPHDLFLHIKDNTVTEIIDQGTDAIPGIPSPFYDFAGQTRPSGGGIDIGADEFVDISDLKGDINGDGFVKLEDAILSLQTIAGISGVQIRNDYALSGTDADGNQKLGLQEVLFIFRHISFVQ